jgi:hypothetical protein
MEEIMTQHNHSRPRNPRGAESATPAPRIPGRDGAACLAGIAAAAIIAVAGCAPVHRGSEQVASEPPQVSYEYSTDDGLLEASARAQDYCSQYAATPSIAGSIIDNPDGTNTVNFDCVKAGMVPVEQAIQVYPAAPAPPRGYVYSSDHQLLAAIQSADAYCDRSGQIATTSIVTNLDGTKNLSFRCVPR